MRNSRPGVTNRIFNRNSNTQEWEYFSKWESAYKKEKDRTPKRFSFECGKNVDCITILPNRRIHFHNHKIKELASLAAHDKLIHPKLGDTELNGCALFMRCLRFRETITYYDQKYSLTKHLSQYTEVFNEIRALRTQLLKMFPVEATTYQETLMKRIPEIVSKLRENLKYRELTNPKGGYNKLNFIFLPSFTGQASIEGSVTNVGNGYRRAVYSNINIKVPYAWYMKIYLKGKATIEGSLILEIKKDYPNNTSLVVAGKPGHGFKITTNFAVVDWIKQSIRWIDETKQEDKLNNFIDGVKAPRRRRTKEEMLQKDMFLDRR